MQSKVSPNFNIFIGLYSYLVEQRILGSFDDELKTPFAVELNRPLTSTEYRDMLDIVTSTKRRVTRKRVAAFIESLLPTPPVNPSDVPPRALNPHDATVLKNKNMMTPSAVDVKNQKMQRDNKIMSTPSSIDSPPQSPSPVSPQSPQSLPSPSSQSLPQSPLHSPRSASARHRDESTFMVDMDVLMSNVSLLLQEHMWEVKQMMRDTHCELQQSTSQLERTVSSLERKMTMLYELQIEKRLHRHLATKHSWMMQCPPMGPKTFSLRMRETNVQRGFKAIRGLKSTPYHALVEERRLSLKLGYDTPTLQLNFWVCGGEHCGVIEGTTSDLLSNKDALCDKLLQLERQIVFARSYLKEPEFVGFVSPSFTGNEAMDIEVIRLFIQQGKHDAFPSVGYHMRHGTFNAIQMGSIPDICWVDHSLPEDAVVHNNKRWIVETQWVQA